MTLTHIPALLLSVLALAGCSAFESVSLDLPPDQVVDAADAVSDTAVDLGDPDLREVETPWVFEPGLKLGTGEVFDRGLLLEADTARPDFPGGDVIEIGLGDQLGDGFYEHGDTTQGTIVAFVTPGWSIDELKDKVGLFHLSGIDVSVDPVGHAIVVAPTGGPTMRFEETASWQRDARHLLVVRWDSRTPLVDGAHIAVWIDGVSSRGETSGWTATDSPGANRVGASDPWGRGGADILLEGLTVYRRVLYDGEFGTDLGRGDELSAIYKGGTGGDPTSVTGSWDVVLALPTSQDTGPLKVAGLDRQGWTHPHAGNLLGTGGTLPDPALWTAVGTATVAAGTPSEALFGSAMVLTTTEPDDLVSHDLTVQSPLLIRALVHSNDGAIPTLRVLGCNSELLGELSARDNPSRAHPAHLVLTTGATDCSQVTIELVNKAPGTSIWHEIEVLFNLVRTPSMEEGAVVNGIFLPTGWDAIRGDVGIPDGGTAAETSVVHSGAQSLKITVGEPDRISHVSQTLGGGLEGRHYAVGGWMNWVAGGPPGVWVTNGNLFASSRAMSTATKFYQTGFLVTGWQEVLGVGRRRDSPPDYNNTGDIIRWGGLKVDPFEGYLDDLWTVALTPVEVHPRPASLPQSTAGGFIRVDGADQVSQVLSQVTAERSALALDLQIDAASGLAPGCQGDFEILELESEDPTAPSPLFTVAIRAGQLALWANGSESVTVGQAPPPGIPFELGLAWTGAQIELTVDGNPGGQLIVERAAVFRTAPTLIRLAAPPARCALFVGVEGVGEAPGESPGK